VTRGGEKVDFEVEVAVDSEEPVADPEEMALALEDDQNVEKGLADLAVETAEEVHADPLKT